MTSRRWEEDVFASAVAAPAQPGQGGPALLFGAERLAEFRIIQTPSP